MNRFLMIFFSYSELYSENNYQCETFTGVRKLALMGIRKTSDNIEL